MFGVSQRIAGKKGRGSLRRANRALYMLKERRRNDHRKRRTDCALDVAFRLNDRFARQSNVQISRKRERGHGGSIHR